MAKVPDAQDDDALKAELSGLKAEFGQRARDYARMETAVGKTIAKLEAAEKLKAERAADIYRDRTAIRTAEVKGMLQNKKQPPAFAVFVDHTGSMTQKPFYAALDGAAVLQSPVALWGSQPEPRWVKDILDPAARDGFKKLGASSDFRPAVREMVKAAALNQLDGKASHFVVISDGEFADYPAAKKEIEKLLSHNFRATIDFVILGRADTGMEFLSEQLAKDFPGKVKHRVVNGPAYWQGTEEDLSKAVQEAVAQSVKERLYPQRKPKAAPKPQAQ